MGRRSHVSANCAHCGAQFFKRNPSSRFCSNSCSQLGAPRNRGRPKTGITLNCAHCGRAFYVRAYRAATAEYCSRSCLAKVHLARFADFRLKPTGRPHHRYETVAVDGRQVRVHRYVMEQHLGRTLTRDEHVHHINGDSLDNRVENLMVVSNAEHQRIELRERGHTRRTG